MKMIKNKAKLGIVIFFAILNFLIAAFPAFATITTHIDVKESFGLGEKIFYNYTLISDIDAQAIIIPHIICPSAPVALIMEKTVVLTKNQPYKDVYYGLVIEDFIGPQTCVAYVQFLSPLQQLVSKNFTIEMSPSFNFSLNTCKDTVCSQKAKVFVLDDEIYLNYDSSIPNPVVSAILTYPDKTSKQLILPTSIKASQLGTHTINVIASKQGYKNLSAHTQFAVIGQEANISTVSLCNNNGICDGQENYQNCPYDCKKPWSDWTSIAYLAIIVVIIIAAVLIVIIKLKKLASSRKGAQLENFYARNYAFMR